MLNIQGVYEVAIRVRDLAKAEQFYCEILGFEVGLRLQEPDRNWVFLRIGSQGMVVLQEESGEWPLQHFAFTVSEADLGRALAYFKEKEISVEGPTLHDWIPAKSLYFRDPDGHDVELCAPR